MITSSEHRVTSLYTLLSRGMCQLTSIAYEDRAKGTNNDPATLQHLQENNNYPKSVLG